MSKYYLLLLILSSFVGCGTDEAPPDPTETSDYATFVEIKATKTYNGDDADHLWWDRQGLKYWHAEIEIVFSQTPINLEVLGVSATHFIDHDENHLDAFYWEQTGNIVTIYLTFLGVALFQDWSDVPLTYEQAKETYPDIDWDDFTAYTIDFTLNWDTGRKRIKGIQIKPSKQILQRFSTSNQ